MTISELHCCALGEHRPSLFSSIIIFHSPALLSLSLSLSLFLSLFRNQLDSEIDSLRVLHTYTLIDSSTHALSFSFLFFFSLFLCPLIPAFDPLNFDRCLTSTPRTPPFAFPGETSFRGIGRKVISSSTGSYVYYYR